MVAWKDSGIKTFADLKGKRVPQVVGSPSPNNQVKGSLAFAGLTLNDVKVVTFNSFTAMYEGIRDGLVDAGPLASTSPIAYQMESSPHGIYWIPMPVADKEGWKRFNDYQPTFSPMLGTIGAGLSKEKPVELCTNATPSYVAMEEKLNEDTAYWITKSLAEAYDIYKITTAAMPAYEPKAGLALPTNFPWHSGSIKYLKEAGLWTDRLEKNQKPLVDRQKQLSELWGTVTNQAADSGVKEAEFPAYWLERRAKAFPNYYRPIE